MRSLAVPFALLGLVATDMSVRGAPISFSFVGAVQPVNLVLTNPYSGEQVPYTGDSGQANVNTSTYMGGSSFDNLSGTVGADVLFIRNSQGQQIVDNVEVVFAGNGNDLIQVADPTFTLNDLTLSGGLGNDILWGNVGGDVMFGGEGQDHIVGGPGDDFILGDAGNDYLGGGTGNDELEGGDGNDEIAGGSGDDRLEGGLGNDVLTGGAGADVYVTGLGFDTLVELSSPELNAIHLQVDINHEDLTYERIGANLHITFMDPVVPETVLGEVVLVGQYSSATAGLDFVIEDEGEGEVVNLRLLFVPEPSGGCFMIMAMGMSLCPGRRRNDAA